MGAVYQGEKPGLIPKAIGTQGDGNGFGSPEDLPQHLHFLDGEAFKGVYRHSAACKKAAFLQGLGQPCQVVPGIQVGSRHQSFIGFKNHPQLPRLLSQALALQPPCCFQKL